MSAGQGSALITAPDTTGGRPRNAFLSRNGINHWACVPREQILRRMAPDECADSRVLHALILWSFCGPEEAQDGVYIRNDQGWRPKDENGKPINKPAKARDIAKLLKMDKGQVSRSFDSLQKRKLLEIRDGILYLVLKPSRFNGDFQKVDSTATFFEKAAAGNPR